MKHKIYADATKWLLVALTVLLAAVLIWQCADIYRSGTAASNMAENGTRIQDIYSLETVVQRITRFAWVGILWLASLVTTLVARAAFPQGEKRTAGISTQTRLTLIKQRTVLTPSMRREEHFRQWLVAAAVLICAVCSGFIAAYFLNPSHFASRELETVVPTMLAYCTPFVGGGLLAILLAQQFAHNSRLREIEEAKNAPKRSPEPFGETAHRSQRALRIALCLAAVALIVAGTLNGGMRDVLMKAINICTECIGLG